MLYLVKIKPNRFLLARAPVKPRVLKVPLEIPVGRFSLERQRATRDGTPELGQAFIFGGGRGWGFEVVGGGNGCSWDNSFVVGGGNLSRHGTIRHDLMGVARHG